MDPTPWVNRRNSSAQVNWAGLGLTDADVTKLLEELGAVAVLDLSDNAIHDGGLQALIAASVSRPELKELRLAGNPFGQLQS